MLEVINQMLKKRHLPIVDLKQYRNTFGFPVRDYYRKLGFDFSREPFNRLTEEFIVEYYSRLNECELFPRTKKVLQKFNRDGVNQSLLSAAKEENLRDKVQYYHIESFFCGIIGLNDHYAESKIEKGRQWIRQLDIPRQKIVLIGDTYHDFEVSYHIGIDCILISNGHQDRQRLLTSGAEVVDSIDEIVKS